MAYGAEISSQQTSINKILSSTKLNKPIEIKLFGMRVCAMSCHTRLHSQIPHMQSLSPCLSVWFAFKQHLSLLRLALMFDQRTSSCGVLLHRFKKLSSPPSHVLLLIINAL